MRNIAPTKRTFSLRSMAKMTLDGQHAPNLCGLVRAWARYNVILHRLYPSKSTDWLNQHPICRLMVEQASHLSGGGPCTRNNYLEAHNEVTRLAALPEDSPENLKITVDDEDSL